jgi:hypothetical protein
MYSSNADREGGDSLSADGTPPNLRSIPHAPHTCIAKFKPIPHCAHTLGAAGLGASTLGLGASTLGASALGLGAPTLGASALGLGASTCVHKYLHVTPVAMR